MGQEASDISQKGDMTSQASELCAAVQGLVLQVAGHSTLGILQWREFRVQLALLILSGCQCIGVDGCAGLGPRLPWACKPSSGCCAVLHLP